MYLSVSDSNSFCLLDCCKPRATIVRFFPLYEVVFLSSSDLLTSLFCTIGCHIFTSQNTHVYFDDSHVTSRIRSALIAGLLEMETEHAETPGFGGSLGPDTGGGS